MAKLHLGPVLSFRGTSAAGDWKVSALIGIDSCVFRTIVTDRFGSVTAEFGNVTGHFGDVTD